MENKQLSIPGLPTPEPKSKPPTQDERIEVLASRGIEQKALPLEVASAR